MHTYNPPLTLPLPTVCSIYSKQPYHYFPLTMVLFAWLSFILVLTCIAFYSDIEWVRYYLQAGSFSDYFSFAVVDCGFILAFSYFLLYKFCLLFPFLAHSLVGWFVISLILVVPCSIVAFVDFISSSSRRS